MSQRTADLYLVDILDAAGGIARSLQGVSFEEFAGKTEKRVRRTSPRRPGRARGRSRGGFG